jgi:hypothetical protein
VGHRASVPDGELFDIMDRTDYCPTPAELTVRETRDLRGELVGVIAAAKLKRSPITEQEIAATMVAAGCLSGAIRRLLQQNKEVHEKFPLEPAPPWKDPRRDVTWENDIIEVFGTAGEVVVKGVPSAPEPDSRVCGELPRTRALAETLVGERFHPGDFEADIRWKPGRPTTTTPLRWGPILDLRKLNEKERSTFATLVAKDAATGALRR